MFSFVCTPLYLYKGEVSARLGARFVCFADSDEAPSDWGQAWEIHYSPRVTRRDYERHVLIDVFVDKGLDLRTGGINEDLDDNILIQERIEFSMVATSDRVDYLQRVRAMFNAIGWHIALLSAQLQNLTSQYSSGAKEYPQSYVPIEGAQGDLNGFTKTSDPEKAAIDDINLSRAYERNFNNKILNSFNGYMLKTSFDLGF